MPGFDRSGPMGNGPMTGGMRGYCNPAAAGYRASFYGSPGFGRGLGLGRGFRGGMGRRAAGGLGREFEYPTPYAGPAGNDSTIELAGLKAQADALRNSLDIISKHIEALENRST